MATENMNQMNIITPDGKTYAFDVVDQEARELAQQALDAAGSGTGGDCNIQRIESLDESNLKNLRDLDSGTYILYGYFNPYSGSEDSITIDSCFAAAVHLNAGSHVMVYNPRNFKIDCYEILESDGSYTYTRDVVSMLELNALIDKVGDMDGLNTTEKSTLVAAINEIAANAGSGSGENAAHAVYVLALSEDEADAQANSDAITAAVAKYKNVILQFGDYPVTPEFVVESGMLDLNGSQLRSVTYKHSGPVAILKGERPVICGGTLVGTYDTADNEEGYEFFEAESLIQAEGVNDALISRMELRNCWGVAIVGRDGFVERHHVAEATLETISRMFKSDQVSIPTGCKYVTAAGSIGYNYIISDKPVAYYFYDSSGVEIVRKYGTPRLRITIPDGAATVAFFTYKSDEVFREFYAYFTDYAESLIVENTDVYYCHSLAMANPPGPTVVNKCRFIGMGKPRPDAQSTARGTTGGIDIEDVQTPELIMSDCYSEDCINLLLFGGYNAVVTNCTGALVRSYRGHRLQLDNCRISTLDVSPTGCPVVVNNTHADSLKIPEAAYPLVSGSISTNYFSPALAAFDSFFADIRDPVASSEPVSGVLNGKLIDNTYRGFRSKGWQLAIGSKVEMQSNLSDAEKRFYGAVTVAGDTYGLTSNFPVLPNGHAISGSTFNIGDARKQYLLYTINLSGKYVDCTFNLSGGCYFDRYGDRMDAPCHLVFEHCLINNADYHLFNFSLYDGSVLEFRGCTIADPSKIVKSGADKINIKITDGKAEDYTMLSDSGNGYEYVVTMHNGALTPVCRASGIEVTTLPTKTEYISGEALDLSGMVVSVARQDGSKEEISGYTAPAALPSDGVVNISYSEFGDTFSASFTVTITEAETAE